MLVERHGAALGDHHLHLTAHLAEPAAELLRVGHRGRQADQLHRVGQPDDDLLPHRAAEPVGEVVHLVHHHEAETAQRRRSGVHHVAQHLGGHHHHLGVPVDGGIAGQQPHLLGAVAVDQVVVLLVRQGLQRSRVEGLAPLRESQVHGELADDRLAGAGRRGDQHPGAALDGPAGLDLVVVEVEAVVVGESPQLRVCLLVPEAGVRLGRGEVLSFCHAPKIARGRRRGGPARTAQCPRRSIGVRGAGVKMVSASGAAVTVSGTGPSSSPSAMP
ncbi:hypothetical protein SDC9_67689 [bioreactor metagenome]|uniref:Uncharacterized protein n=1 Tax=bioreactor metagenome TaxID=1076179 RepID=A0A644XYF7_9ZZZZ